ncbi:hypothetical protein LPB41_15570 [Thalassospira sp. MA62]|nr:hypothetical protein [Thalassospira sp. MA62]
MKLSVILAVATLLIVGAWGVPLQASQTPIVSDQTIEHGGGCRKSSPPGQCCHMDNKAGSVHCH